MALLGSGKVAPCPSLTADNQNPWLDLLERSRPAICLYIIDLSIRVVFDEADSNTCRRSPLRGPSMTVYRTHDGG